MNHSEIHESEDFGAAISVLGDFEIHIENRMPFFVVSDERFPVICPKCKSATEITPSVLMSDYGVNAGRAQCPSCASGMQIYFSHQGVVFSFVGKLDLPVTFTLPEGEFCWFRPPV